MRGNLRWKTISKMTLIDITFISCFIWLPYKTPRHCPSHPCYTDCCVNAHIAVLSWNTKYRNSCAWVTLTPIVLNLAFTDKKKSILFWLDRKQNYVCSQTGWTARGDWLINEYGRLNRALSNQSWTQIHWIYCLESFGNFK